MIGALAAGGAATVYLAHVASNAGRMAASAAHSAGFAAASASRAASRETVSAIEGLGEKIDGIDHARDLYLALRERYARDYPSAYEAQLLRAVRELQSRWDAVLRLLHRPDLGPISLWELRDLMDNYGVQDAMKQAAEALRQEGSA